MAFKSPFDPLDLHDRRVFGTITATAGFVGVALAAYVVVTATGLGAVITALIAGACGIFSFALAERLFRNHSPYKEGYLVSPWLTLGIGLLFVAVGAAAILGGDRDSAWLLVPGLAAAVFALRHLREHASHPSRRPGDGT